MSREALDFRNIKGDIAFLNGIYTAYMEEILYPAIERYNDDSMYSIVIDIFSIEDPDNVEKEIRVDVALRRQLKEYLELGYYDKDMNFTPVPSSDDFHIPFEEEMQKVEDDETADEILEDVLFSFFRGGEVFDEKLRKAVKEFVLRTHWFLYAHFSGAYKASQGVVEQLNNNMHFHLITVGALFLKFGDLIMMLTDGYSD